jgi:AcrR family transcriptional regulator
MVDALLAPLPKGRHNLTRAQVAQAQRVRLAVAMAEVMAENGYVGTPVAAVLKRAGVSRETFYQLYDDKLACFLDALDFVGDMLVTDLTAAVAVSGEPLERAGQAVERYLRTIIDYPAFARLFLVEVHAAGAEAMRRRNALQDRIVEALTNLLDARTARERFACRAYVAAVSSLVAVPVVTGDARAVAALRRPLLDHLRSLVRDVRD